VHLRRDRLGPDRPGGHRRHRPLGSVDRPITAITVLPLRGDPIGTADTRSSLSTMAFELRDALNRLNGNSATNEAAARSLAGVPAIVPAEFSDAEAAAVWKLAAASRDYSEIFAGATPLIDRTDCIVTSIGSLGECLGRYTLEYLRAWRQPNREEWVRERVLGDIAGVLIPRPGLPEEEAAEVRAVNERHWLGVRLPHFTRCANQPEPKPGVILIAFGGMGKAEVVYECCVTLNIVTHLVVDHELRKGLQSLLQMEEGP
jgi:hypothetical protein